MAEPTATPTPPEPPEPQTGPFGRPVALFAVCLVNLLLAVIPLVNLLRGPIPAPPPEAHMAPFPTWFRAFAIGQSGALLLSVVGLWFFKRWGFALLALAYGSMVAALLAAHQVWVCAAAVQFPLFAIASRQWKYLR